jgi:hypothetical protein
MDLAPKISFGILASSTVLAIGVIGISPAFAQCRPNQRCVVMPTPQLRIVQPAPRVIINRPAPAPMIYNSPRMVVPQRQPQMVRPMIQNNSRFVTPVAPSASGPRYGSTIHSVQPQVRTVPPPVRSGPNPYMNAIRNPSAGPTPSIPSTTNKTTTPMTAHTPAMVSSTNPYSGAIRSGPSSQLVQPSSSIGATVRAAPSNNPYAAAIGSATGGSQQLRRGVSDPVALRVYSPQYTTDCVLFVRHGMNIKMPSTDLTTFGAKKSIINVSGPPRVGDVAIIKVNSGEFAPNGHLAVVTNVSNNSLGITEAHWRKDLGADTRISTGTNISDAEQQLNIVGYYRP